MAYTSITRATLRARLQDRYTGDAFWTATEANDALNEALRWFNLYTGFWRVTATAVTGVAARFISVPGTLTARTRVFRSGKVLTKYSIVEFYRYIRDWRTQSTTDGGNVPSTIRAWAPIGLGSIAIWPADAAGGTTLTFDGVKVTPILTADGQFLDLGNEEVALILSEALYALGFKRPSLLATLQPLHAFFLKGCLERNDQLRTSSYFRAVAGLDQTPREEPLRQPVSP